MSKAQSPDDLRDRFLNELRGLVAYWDGLPNLTSKQKLDGLAFSVLGLLDGCTPDFPAVDLVMRPHPDDKAYSQERGEDWVEDGTTINEDAMLHELWHRT